MTNTEINKKCAEILGIHWHETIESDFASSKLECKHCGISIYSNDWKHPDFFTDAGAVRLLRELEKQEWYRTFLFFLLEDCPSITDMYKFITTPDLLAEKVLEWDARRGKG